MITVKKILGHSALAALLLVLAACNSASEAEPQQTQGSPSPSASASAAPSASASAAPSTSASAAPSAPVSAVPSAPASAAPASSEPAESQVPQAPGVPEEGAPPTAMEAASTVLRALSRGNMETLASWAHPDKGVRFSPYAHVDTATDLVFTREQLEGLMKDSKPYVWGKFAGSGENIKLTFAEYFKRFVYDADFMNKAEISLNKGLGQGTTLNNINEVYPKDSYDFVEYHIAGVDPANEGMDWRSLRLVFEKMGEDRALVGIVHDQWTP
ncbi:hypothetical protein [Paenibacillus sonchi]|uniref:hypothetical protein n=1 Tax=Paenibacillus sonchi TaxID=373687 RepID=UPI001E59B651|nr:hypothetical protein [Paenibacillus sonchi]MCE3199205.1 hypothetical protein [Paenibacillus sonchi]